MNCYILFQIMIFYFNVLCLHEENNKIKEEKYFQNDFIIDSKITKSELSKLSSTYNLNFLIF